MFREELTHLLEPLGALRTSADVRPMVRSLGQVDALADHKALQTALAQAASIVDSLRTIDDASLDTWDGIRSLITISADAFAAARAVERAVTDPAVAPLVRDLGRQIINRLVVLHLRARWPRLHAAAAALTLIAPAETRPPQQVVLGGTRITRMPWTDDLLQLERLDDLLARPWQMLGESYLRNGLATAADAHDAADRLFPIMRLAATSLGLRSFRDVQSLDPPPPPAVDIGEEDLVDFPGGSDENDGGEPLPASVVDPSAYLSRHLPRLVLLVPGSNDSARLGLSLTVSSAAHDGGVAGVIVDTTGALSWNETRGPWRFTGSSDGRLPSFVFGPNGLALAPSAGSHSEATGRLEVTRIPHEGPDFVFGNPSGTRLELGNVRFGADIAMTTARRAISLAIDVDKARLVIAPAEGDGFLRKVLPAEGLQIECNIGLTLSSDRGLDIGVADHGQALSGATPVGRSIGPVRIESLTRDLHPVTTNRGRGISISVGARVATKLGPIAVTLDAPGIGIDVLWALKDPAQTPNLGVVHVDGPGLRAPTSVGLAVDSPLVQGAGALQYDPGRQQYGGALALLLGGRFALNVAGLLTTRMPDGSDGYSLVLLGTVQFPPISIGFGFSLNTVGALVGINRAIDVDALTGALAGGDLEAVLFPRNPSAMVAVPGALGKLFPPKLDAHVVGVLLGFTWGPSSIARIDLGVVYDTSAPARLIAVGRLSIERPHVTLHLIALGVVDFEQGELDLQARLVDSRLLGADLSGDAAIMVRWGDDGDLVLSIGGFHPAYRPPTSFSRRFPPLRRLSLRANTDESRLRLALQAYVAVTPNTVQMGARVDLGVTAGPLSVDGMVAFDALIQWDPSLYIDVMVRGSVAIRAGGTTLVGASLAAHLIAADDWFVDGIATISILWWDLDVSFRIGDKPQRPALPPVDGVAQLAAALADARSWGTQVAANGLITVRRTSMPGGALVFHPLDELTVRQQVVPLGVRIDRIDAAPLTAARTFDMAVTVGGIPATTEPLNDAFALAKYFDMSDADKLSAPSFEQLQSGVRLRLNAAAAAAPAVMAGWTYDEFVLTGQGMQPATPQSFVADAAAVGHALAASAAAEAPLRRTGVARYRAPADALSTVATGVRL